jgi:large subunit ribosomal protein L17
MRHGNHKYKLGVAPSHRVALMKNLAVELIDHGKIKTTQTKCRALKIYVEKLVTIAKEDTLSNRRLVLSKINNASAVKKLFAEIGPKFKTRPGGYTRIVKVADNRYSDGSKLGYIAFVE